MKVIMSCAIICAYKNGELLIYWILFAENELK